MRFSSLSWFISRRMSIASESQINLFYTLNMWWECQMFFLNYMQGLVSDDYFKRKRHIFFVRYQFEEFRASQVWRPVLYLWGKRTSLLPGLWMSTSVCHFWHFPEYVFEKCQTTCCMTLWVTCGSHAARPCPVDVWHHGLLNPLLFEKLVSVWLALSLYDASEGWKCCLAVGRHRGWNIFCGSHHQHRFLRKHQTEVWVS